MRVDPINRIKATILRIPTVRAHLLSVATMTEQRTILVEIETRDGLTGIGEAATIGGLAYSDESPDSIRFTIEHYLAPVLLDQNACAFGDCLERLHSAAVGNFFAKMAIETALLDIVGQRANLPISELLGGRRCKRLEVAWTLASGDTEQDIEEGRAMLTARRHRHFKLKIGKRDWRSDIAHCRAIADALGDQASIRVDLNQAWDFATAKWAVPALAEAGIVLVEQPLAASDYHNACALRGVSEAAIMADEALRGGPASANAIAQAQAADVFALKIAQAGGLSACRAVADIARANNISLYGGTMLEGPVATLASAHLFATLGDLEWGTELFGPLLLTEDILKTPITYSDFGLTVPDEPGLGLPLNPDAITDCAERERSLAPA